jgi:5-(aminomethyl)-3-furanmethanol phosphate kinase
VNPRRLAAVVKFGGSLLNDPPQHARVCAALGDLNRRHALLVVPGGGPLADAVRTLDRRMSLGDDVSHWMAILAMDQHARLLANRIHGALVVDGPEEIRRAVADGHLPVLAPTRWLEAADPLPHEWSVTSDSIAAWVASAVGAPSIVLVKSIDAPLPTLVDGYFTTALASHITATVVSARRIDELEARLG